MDAFYASIEQRDHPQYREKPLAVGGTGPRGVVAAASYEARKYGIRSAMAGSIARRKCPGLIMIPPRFEVYKKVSSEIMEIFREYTDLVEPLSLDEAFLDVTNNKKGMSYATEIAVEIKEKIRMKTGLTASAGVSYNKFLAKIASDMDKPDGLYVIRPEKAEEFLEKLDIGKFYGIGKVTARKMKNPGIEKGKDLKNCDLADLIRLFGKNGHFYYQIVRGIDDRPVRPERIRKSISTERTFSTDLHSYIEISKQVDLICKELNERIGKHQISGRTLTMKIRYGDFTTITRGKTFPVPVKNLDNLAHFCREIIDTVDYSEKGLRLIGLGISNLEDMVPPGNKDQLELDL